MKRVITTEKFPIKSWVELFPPPDCMDQIINLANLPFVHKHVAIMPDAHKGYGMPIGGVLSTVGVIVPNAIGVDIGCGVSAIQTSLKGINKDILKNIIERIKGAIPVGSNRHKKPQENTFLLPGEWGPIIAQEEAIIDYQIGTLGRGNHFIEIQQDSDDYIWVMLHSGSRNLGYKVAKYYNDIAIAQNKRWYSSIPESHELAFLPLDSVRGRLYLNDMKICIDFARANRKLMMDRIMEIFDETIDCSFSDLTKSGKIIDVAHNYAVMENHFGKNVMVHRKGAIRARMDEIGIIPGSQGTSSYIVWGRGNLESFQSCSHGAGRRMSRTQARNILDLEQEKTQLDTQGTVHTLNSKRDLDEAPGAYKDIDSIIAAQEDLITIEKKLRPIATIKG
jgi:tRNA-splicing ligase RtcB